MGQKKILVLTLKEDNSAINKYRIIDPHIKLNQYYSDEYYVEMANYLEVYDTQKCKSFDGIFYHVALEQMENFAVQTQKLKDLGIKIIIDIDDYWEYPPSHIYYKFFTKAQLKPKTMSALKKAHLVTTTTEYFANKIKSLNKNVEFLFNSVDLNEKQFQIKPKTNSKITIGYVAGVSHLEDIKLLRGLLTSLKRKNTQIQLCGFNVEKDKGENSTWHKMEQEITDNYNLDNKLYIEFLHEFQNKNFSLGLTDDLEYVRKWTQPITNYMTLYDDLNVCVAPLKTNTFNHCKSSLKMIEAGAKKKPIVVSDLSCYSVDAIHNKNAIVVPENKEHKMWIKSVNELIDNENMRIDLGNSLYELIQLKYDITKNICKRKEIYDKLLQ